MEWPESRFDVFLELGLTDFNTGRFWHAHEAWETIWLESQDPDLRRFLQGLIQIAAAYHHVQRGTVRGAVRLFDAGIAKLRGSQPGLCNLALGSLIGTSLEVRAWADAFPQGTHRDDVVSRLAELPPFPTLASSRGQ